MKDAFKIIVPAIPGAIMAGLIWFYVNKFVPHAGPGVLERQSWPLNNIYFCAAMGAAFSASGAAVKALFGHRRRQSFEAVAAMAGLEYRGSVDRNDLKYSGQLNVFQDWTEGTNLSVGKLDRTNLQVFDVKTVRSSRRGGTGHAGGNSTTTENQTVYLLPAGEIPFPRVSILPKRRIGWAFDLLGLKGMELHADDTNASEQDRQALQKFNQSFLITQGPIANSQMTSSELSDEASLFRQLRPLIRLPLVKKLLSTSDWSLEFCPSHVAIWKGRQLVKPREFSQRLDEVLAIHRLLVDNLPGRSEIQLDVRGSAKMRINTSVTSFLPLAASGCAGMFLAFALFMPIFFLLADKYPWIVFAWPVFGMIVMAISISVGSRLMRK